MPVQSNIYDARRRMEDALVQTDVLWKKKYELRQHLVHQAQHHHQAFPRDSSEDTDVDDPLSKVVSNSISKMHILSLIHDSLDTQHSQEQEEAFGRGLSNHPSSNHRDEGSGLDHVRIVSDQWQAMIADEVRSLAKEQNSGHALVRRRSYAASTEEMKLAATSASFLFDTSDLLEAIKDIQPLNETQEAQEQHWGLLQVKLALVPTWSQLQTRYHELQPRLSSSYSHEGTPVLANCSHRALAKACRVGLAQGSRAKCWMQALDRVSGRKDTDQQQRAMEEILIQVPRAPEDPPLEDLHVHENATDAPMSLEYITDAVYYADVMEMGNHVDYFPFVEILTQVMLAFSRDPWIHEHVQVDAFPRIFDKTTDEQMLIPPSGVQPYRGLVLYVAPLCYLYENPNDLYRVFRQMYTRYWVKLQAIETRHSDSLLVSIHGVPQIHTYSYSYVLDLVGNLRNV